MTNFIKEHKSKHPRFYEILRFLIIGGVATIIDMVVMSIIIFLLNRELFLNNFFNVFSNSVSVQDWHVIIATVIGFISGLIFNYIFSLLYVYDYQSNNAKSKRGFILFLAFSTIGLILHTIGMYIFYSLLGVNEWVAKIILTIIVLIFNYITRKIFIFKKDFSIGDEDLKNK